MVTTRYCADCRSERSFEQPPCADKHGTDCPEWICVECGSAVVVGERCPELVRTAATAA